MSLPSQLYVCIGLYSIDSSKTSHLLCLELLSESTVSLKISLLSSVRAI